MNSLLPFQKILILPVRTFLSLGAIFALVTAAHVQNLLAQQVPGVSLYQSDHYF